MSSKAFGEISREDLKRMIERNIAESKSIYAPSGPPDPRLRILFGEVYSDERTVRLSSSVQAKIDVVFLLDLEPLSDMDPETLHGVTNILLHDGRRRLASRKIDVGESSYRDDPDRLVYACEKSSRSRIKKFIEAWEKR
jgi:hypothetical protein